MLYERRVCLDGWSCLLGLVLIHQVPPLSPLSSSLSPPPLPPPTECLRHPTPRTTRSRLRSAADEGRDKGGGGAGRRALAAGRLPARGCGPRCDKTGQRRQSEKRATRERVQKGESERGRLREEWKETRRHSLLSHLLSLSLFSLSVLSLPFPQLAVALSLSLPNALAAHEDTGALQRTRACVGSHVFSSPLSIHPSRPFPSSLHSGPLSLQWPSTPGRSRVGGGQSHIKGPHMCVCVYVCVSV